MKKKFFISSISIFLIIPTLVWAYPYTPGSGSDYTAIKCNGVLSDTSGFNADGSEYVGTNPTRKWVNWNGTYCFITNAQKNGDKYYIQYATDEWMLIQMSL